MAKKRTKLDRYVVGEGGKLRYFQPPRDTGGGTYEHYKKWNKAYWQKKVMKGIAGNAIKTFLPEAVKKMYEKAVKAYKKRNK